MVFKHLYAIVIICLLVSNLAITVLSGNSVKSSITYHLDNIQGEMTEFHIRKFESVIEACFK